jgi:hypothetical protein
MSEQTARRRNRKQLLIAAVGVATVSYLGSGCNRVQVSSATSGNLMAPPPAEAAVPQLADAGQVAPGPIAPSGNLMAPPQDAALQAPDVLDTPNVSGNLMPPPPAQRK